MAKLIEDQYDRNDMDFIPVVHFVCVGDVLEIIPAYESDTAIRVEFFGDEIDRISEIDILTGEVKDELKHIAIFPRHLITWLTVRISNVRWQILKKN